MSGFIWHVDEYLHFIQNCVQKGLLIPLLTSHKVLATLSLPTESPPSALCCCNFLTSLLIHRLVFTMLPGRQSSSLNSSRGGIQNANYIIQIHHRQIQCCRLNHCNIYILYGLDYQGRAESSPCLSAFLTNHLPIHLPVVELHGARLRDLKQSLSSNGATKVSRIQIKILGFRAGIVGGDHNTGE